MADEIAEKSGENCLHCGGPKNVRNPTGNCDHLYWPDYLTAEAKKANGYILDPIFHEIDLSDW